MLNVEVARMILFKFDEGKLFRRRKSSTRKTYLQPQGQAFKIEVEASKRTLRLKQNQNSKRIFYTTMIILIEA